jgi:hypothetical protein
MENNKHPQPSTVLTSVSSLKGSLLLLIIAAVTIAVSPVFSQKTGGGISDSLIRFDERLLPGNDKAAVPLKVMAAEKSASQDADSAGTVKSADSKKNPVKDQKVTTEEESWFSQMVASDQTVVNLIVLLGLGIVFILFRFKNRTSRRSYN